MNPCDDVRAQLPLYLGGDLEAPLAEQVRAHLEAPDDGCRGCARELAQLERVRARLLELPQRSPAPQVDVWPQVRQGLVASGLLGQAPRAERRGAVARPAGRLLTWPRLASAAAAVALMALGFQLLRGPGAPGADPAPGTGVRDSVAAPTQGAPLPEVVPVLAPSGLRRLTAEDTPLHDEARPFLEWMHGGSGPRLLPGAPGGRMDPNRPTFASDRSLR
jgi:hypothetical protein